MNAIRSRRQSGFTLPELMVAIVVFGMSSVFCAKSLINRTEKRVDTGSMKTMLTLASRRSVTQARHFGVHFDSTLHTVGFYEDQNKDNVFDNTDTLSALIKLNPLGKVRILSSDNSNPIDVVFKKNGSVAAGTSVQITYVAPTGDSSTMTVIAASGQVIGP